MRIEFTKEALGIMTEAQRDTIRNAADNPRIGKIEVSIAFDLPTGYVAVWFRYDARFGNDVYGGIDPDGNLST